MPGTTETLPSSLREDGLHRMGWVGLALALSALGVLITGYYVQPGWVDPKITPSSYTIGTLGIVLSGLVLFALPRLRWLKPDTALDVGLVLQVGAGFFISIAENSIPWGAEPIRGSSSVAVWITVFALAVPMSFGKALVAALATASMGPIGLGIQILIGNVANPPQQLWLVLFFSQYLMAAGATLLGKLIYRLGKQVKVAEEYGGYQLVSLLGKGGMGEVWRARHHLVGRVAAVKLIRPDLVQAESGNITAMLRRFEREANATASLHSPHTVSLYNYGLSENGMLYYVMELLDGYDLETLVNRFGPVPAARAIHILKQVCDSLEEAHAAGLIHRDIKPGNILLCRLGTSRDFAKVLDFGLVQFMNPTGSQHSVQVIKGTPAYMAPEAFTGGGTDPRTDIYSLGCVAYWILCGRRVFDAHNLPQMMHSHLTQTPVAPSMNTDNPIPAPLDELVLSCLDKDPARRPASARELSAGLRACSVEPAWTPEDAERWWTEATGDSSYQNRSMPVT